MMLSVLLFLELRVAPGLEVADNRSCSKTAALPVAASLCPSAPAVPSRVVMAVEVPELRVAPGPEVSKVGDSVVVPDPESGVVPEHSDLLPLEALLSWECPALRDYLGPILEVECSRARHLGYGRATLAV